MGSNLNKIFFIVVSGVVTIGYLIQFNTLHDLAAGLQQQQQQGSNNNNNNMIVMMPIMQQQGNSGSGEANSNRQLSPDSMLRPPTQQYAAPKRTRILESDVMPQLTNARKPITDLIQPALGPGGSSSDPTLQPYSKSLRGLDLNLPAHQKLRENRILYLITPTYTRQTQIVDLTRLGQTLRLARESGFHWRLYWIILEDAQRCSHRVRQMAEESGVPFAHKAVKTSLAVRSNPKAHRGLEQRNAALDIIEQVGAEGVVYFMDDDNAYNVQLMHELSYTTHVSVFGVGLPGGSAYERCHVDPATGKVDKLLTTWEAPRTFAIDMAGFAFATHHLASTRAAGKPMRFTQSSKPGYLENDLILFAAKGVTELEPLAANCTRILAWHVKTVGNNLYYNPEPTKQKFDLMVSLV